ncbi:hypothetical protein V6N11_059666 [Hibiscus sabdariffa]|uniref:Uncharacterized protein n=1 Tax=Hibiscus sabdariffa TaxID=183260 RepID=A0ABR2NXV7_9ROSI
MLQDYIPSLKMSCDDSGSVSSDNSSQHLSRERVKLLPSDDSSSDMSGRDPSFKCFSISELKKKVMAGLWKNCEKEGQWSALPPPHSAARAFPCLKTASPFPTPSPHPTSPQLPQRLLPRHRAIPTPFSESENISQLLSHIKLLIRRRTAAIAALDAGLYSEAIRHFSKIVDGRRPAPQGFLAECYMQRASAYKASGRIAESISDCNKTLALDPTCSQALHTRASLFETIRCLPDCLHDLEHLKLLYNTILRDRKLPGPAWKRHYVRYREIPGHKPDKATNFIERCEFADERDLDSVKDRAKMSALLLYRLVQKGYSNVMATIIDEENTEKERKKAVAGLQAAQTAIQVQQTQHSITKPKPEPRNPPCFDDKFVKRLVLQNQG